jgi:cytochrome c oxidase subunit 2
MWTKFPLFPEEASTIAGGVDQLYFLLIALSLFFSALVFVLIFFFAIRYRRRKPDEVPKPILGSLKLELFWSITPGVIGLFIFGWGASVYFRNYDPPPGAMEIYVVAKQWMWKLQHPEGRREINELHVPAGRPVKLTMTSEDVIHSFYVPAFRVKRDLVPGQYSSLWFQASKPGKYHLFCAEYCGTEHSGMIGWVYVMEPEDYEKWLGGAASGETMAEAGRRLFEQSGCANCHQADATGRGPSLQALYGSAVLLQTGEKVIADESYLRESILYPQRKVVAGYRTLMPTFQGQIEEENLLQIIAYIKSLGSIKRMGTEQ